MATRFSTRFLFSASKQTCSSGFSRSHTSHLLSTCTSSLVWLRPLVPVAANLRQFSPTAITVGAFGTRHMSSSLNDPTPNLSNWFSEGEILPDGCDFEHWYVCMRMPEDEPTRDQIIDSYIKTLAMVVGSEEEARMKIYSVSTKYYYSFGALLSEELALKMKGLPQVFCVAPDCYLPWSKSYEVEPFINGQAVPYDPKYHERYLNRRIYRRRYPPPLPRTTKCMQKQIENTQNLGS